MHDRKKVDTYLYFLFNLAARWGGLPKPRCGRFTAGKEPWFPVNLDKPQSRFRRMRKILPSLGFEFLTVQALASGNQESIFYIKSLFII